MSISPLETCEACNGSPQHKQSIAGLGEAGYQRVAKRSVLVILDGFELSGTSCLEVLQLTFQVACLRCTQVKAVTFSAPDLSEAASKKSTCMSSSGMCTKCSQDMCLTLAVHLVHCNSNALAHLRAEGCSPVDLLPSCFGAQCDSCSALAAMRHVQVCPLTCDISKLWASIYTFVVFSFAHLSCSLKMHDSVRWIVMFLGLHVDNTY